MPNIAVTVAILENEKVLLTRREDFEVWCLPGGQVDEGETLAQAALREVREETGLEVELTRLVGTYTRTGGFPDLHIILYAARPIGGELRLQPGETIELGYFSQDELPADTMIGQERRILDAMNGACGISMSQKMDMPTTTRRELYEERDRSGLSRQEFYFQRMASVRFEESLEVGFTTDKREEKA